jgi:hypothetical protein
MKPNNRIKQLFINEAESYVGYTTAAGQPDIFSTAIGNPGAHWNGAFIDVCAKKAGLELSSSHLLTNVALAVAFQEGRIHLRPAVGDIVFIESSTDPSQLPFNQPHVGIVIDTSAWSTHGMVQCVEAQTSNGLPRGTNLRNGVYKRSRYKYEVIAFSRPNFSRALNELGARQTDELDPGKDSTNKPLEVVRSSIIRPGLKHPHVRLIQLALAKTVGLTGVPKGEFEHKTRAAYAHFQRTLGQVNPDGIPDPTSLSILARRTQLFTTAD